MPSKRRQFRLGQTDQQLSCQTRCGESQVGILELRNHPGDPCPTENLGHIGTVGNGTTIRHDGTVEWCRMTLLGSVKLETGVKPTWPQASIATHLRTSVKSWPNSRDRLGKLGKAPKGLRTSVRGFAFQDFRIQWGPGQWIASLNWIGPFWLSCHGLLLFQLPLVISCPCPIFVPQTFNCSVSDRVLMPTKATIGVHQQHVLGISWDGNKLRPRLHFIKGKGSHGPKGPDRRATNFLRSAHLGIKTQHDVTCEKAATKTIRSRLTMQTQGQVEEAELPGWSDSRTVATETTVGMPHPGWPTTSTTAHGKLFVNNATSTELVGDRWVKKYSYV